MKLLFALFAALTAQTAFASPHLDCSIHELGDDRYVGVKLFEKAIDISLHETSFTVAAHEFVQNANTRAVLSKNILVTSEGTEETRGVNALLIFEPQTRTLKLSLYLNGEQPIVQTLNYK